ncbi:MAG: hypothetical protein K2Y37_22380 [Pirellulales bacterium]|nr:hypothetical protein [Pirellulales bacterium]
MARIEIGELQAASGKLKVTGDAKKLTVFFGLLDQFEFSFNLVTPYAPRSGAREK